MKIEGLEKVITALRNRAAKSAKGDDVSVTVGFSQGYALYVHENRQAYHPVGRAGYLLDVARELQSELGWIVATALARGKTVGQALLLAGLRLQRESQKNVPVDTGALKGSAFTRLHPGKR